MARPLIPFVRGGGWYPTPALTPLVHGNGKATSGEDGGDEPSNKVGSAKVGTAKAG